MFNNGKSEGSRGENRSNDYIITERAKAKRRKEFTVTLMKVFDWFKKPWSKKNVLVCETEILGSFMNRFSYRFWS